MNRLTAQQYNAYSQEWRASIDRWVKQGYTVSYFAGALIIEHRRGSFRLVVAWERTHWMVVMIWPTFLPNKREEDADAIATIQQRVDWFDEIRAAARAHGIADVDTKGTEVPA